MTTSVTVLISGNKACEVKVEGQGSSDTAATVKPGNYVVKYIHGDQVVSVREVGDFLT